VLLGVVFHNDEDASETGDLRGGHAVAHHVEDVVEAGDAFDHVLG
jgi:hypothetical protein